MAKLQIHNLEGEYERALNRVLQIKTTKKNQEIVLKFKDYCFLNNISKFRLLKYLNLFRYLFTVSKKDLDKATKNDIENIVANINGRENLAITTKMDYKILLKRFYKWLLGNDQEYPEQVKWIKCRIKQSEKKLPGEGELITNEDVEKLIQVADHPRDKAFVALLFESGCRIGEIGSMTLGSVVFDKYGTLITVSGKTGSRKIRVVNATPYLMQWIQTHPRPEKNNPLWINYGMRRKHQLMSYNTFAIILRRLFKKAGINKRHNPHLFRHSRATFLANHLTEFQMNHYFGWVQGSNMPATYVHLSGREVEDSILQLNGLVSKKEGDNSQPKPRLCPRCDTVNTATSTYCMKCAFVLDQFEAVRLQEKEVEEKKMEDLSKEILRKLMDKPEIMKAILDQLKIEKGT